MRKLGFVMSLLFAFMNTIASTDDYRNVLFGSSVMNGNYGYSVVSYSGMSWVENVKGRIPLSDSVWFTPSNALSLKYASSDRGHWEVAVNFPERRAYKLQTEDEVLSFRIYLQEGVRSEALPTIALLQGDTCTQQLNFRPYVIGEWGFNQWLNIQIPLSEIPNLTREVAISGVSFYQSNSTPPSAVQHILIDQIELSPRNRQPTELAFPAVLDRVSGADQHVLLEWQLPLDPGIRYVKIYRSADNQQFQAIAIRPIMGTAYVDMVPVTDKSYYYRVSWVDHDYKESPLSNTLKVDVKSQSDEVLMDAIQAAHINFFIRRTEFNSGMHAVRFMDRDAVVSVEDTGYSLLAYTVGVSKDLITGRAYIRRLNSLVDFLCDHAEQYKGAFPAYLNGRTGRAVLKSEYRSGVDIRATSSLMQGLLVSRNYLKNFLATRQDSRQDRAFRERIENTVKRIDQLWKGVQWNEFTQANGTVLYDNWSPETGFDDAYPIGGFGPHLLVYILALSSPDYPIADEAYEWGLGINRTKVPIDESAPVLLEEDIQLDVIPDDAPSVTQIQEVSDSPLNDTKVDLRIDNEAISTDSLQLKYKIIEAPYSSDTVVYGFHLDVGHIDHSLLEAYAPFLAFDPRYKRDVFANYELSVTHLIQAYKRRDNELDAGNLSSDIWGTAQGQWSRDRLPVIVPAISIASYAFVPETAKRAARALYQQYGQALFTEYGFRNWISVHEHQISENFRGLNQATIPVMIENGRNGLIWNLFMQHEDIDRTVEKFFKEDL